MLKRIGSVVLAIIVLAGLGLLIHHQYQAALEEKVLAAKQRRKSLPPLLVKVEAVGTGPIAESLQLTGTVESRSQATVFSMVPGTVKRIRVKEGQWVKKGQILAQLKAWKMVLGVRQARTGLALARANLFQMELTYRRMKALYKDGAIPKAQFDQVATGYKAAQLQVKQAEAGVGLAESQRSDAIIRAPISGVVLKKFVSRGDVSSAAAMMKTSPIVVIADVSRVKVKVSIVEKDLGRVHVGQEAAVTVDAYPGRIFRGKVTQMGAMVDPMTRTAEVTVEVSNPLAAAKPVARTAPRAGRRVSSHRRRGHHGHSRGSSENRAGERLLKVGMFARVSIVIAKRDRTLVVSRDAIMGAAGSEHAFVVEAGKARRRKVVLGLHRKNRVEVLQGLRDGDRLIVLGQRGLEDGQPVRVSSTSEQPTDRGHAADSAVEGSRERPPAATPVRRQMP
ncbi:MAG: efflux RND transporter periplasmic adaptor subunit [Deltaproteobacteria bacterium]|nr:efflux RND transporter periplasmic adaptor subunit [Deltaproteobacteria bacterium]